MADTAPTTNGGAIDSLKGSKSAYEQLAHGPVLESVKNQSAKTTSELSNLANARQTPAYPAATGQPLTHYHSFFSELLSWNNPRASAIAYGGVVAIIFAARYLDVLRYTLKATWVVLGVAVLAEVAGKTILSNGLASQLRPRKYYTVPREKLEHVVGDVHELVNFFVIEFQRILFAENISASAAAAIGAFLAYFLVKFVPYWGLALISTTVAFFGPLIYTSNQELIDHHLKQASEVISSQTHQFRKVASKHTSQATEITKQYVGDYTHKAQEILRRRSGSLARSGKTDSVSESTTTHAQEQEVNQSVEFPDVPKQEFNNFEEPAIKAEQEPLLAA